MAPRAPRAAADDAPALVGVVEASLDDKSRLVLPARFRRSLPATVTLWVSAQRSLLVGTSEAHLAAVRALESINEPLAAAAARTARVYVDVATLDSHGRISLPAALVRAARLSPGSEVLIEGHRGHLEVWDASARESLLDRVAERLFDSPERLGELDDLISAATSAAAGGGNSDIAELSTT